MRRCGRSRTGGLPGHDHASSSARPPAWNNGCQRPDAHTSQTHGDDHRHPAAGHPDSGQADETPQAAHLETRSAYEKNRPYAKRSHPTNSLRRDGRGHTHLHEGHADRWRSHERRYQPHSPPSCHRHQRKAFDCGSHRQGAGHGSLHHWSADTSHNHRRASRERDDSRRRGADRRRDSGHRTCWFRSLGNAGTPLLARVLELAQKAGKHALGLAKLLPNDASSLLTIIGRALGLRYPISGGCRSISYSRVCRSLAGP